MFELTAVERAFLTEQRALTRDASGHEVLVGLNLEETNFYVQYVRNGHKPLAPGDDDRYLGLHQRHESQRRAILAAERQLKDDHPSVH